MKTAAIQGPEEATFQPDEPRGEAHQGVQERPDRAEKERRGSPGRLDELLVPIRRCLLLADPRGHEGDRDPSEETSPPDPPAGPAHSGSE